MCFVKFSLNSQINISYEFTKFLKDLTWNTVYINNTDIYKTTFHSLEIKILTIQKNIVVQRKFNDSTAYFSISAVWGSQLMEVHLSFFYGSRVYNKRIDLSVYNIGIWNLTFVSFDKWNIYNAVKKKLKDFFLWCKNVRSWFFVQNVNALFFSTQGEICSQPCDEGTYGTNCNSTCSCYNNATCDPKIGTCFCAAGYIGEK